VRVKAKRAEKKENKKWMWEEKKGEKMTYKSPSFSPHQKK
jgi:hypothetical protein